MGSPDAAAQHQPASSIHAVHLKDILREIYGKEANGVHDDTPMNGNASSYDTPAGAVHTINWKKKFGGLGPSELRRLRQVEEEKTKLKRLVADLSLDKAMLQDVLAKKL